MFPTRDRGPEDGVSRTRTVPQPMYSPFFVAILALVFFPAAQIYNEQYRKAVLYIFLAGLLLIVLAAAVGLSEPLFGMVAPLGFIFMWLDSVYTAQALREGFTVRPFDVFGGRAFRLDFVERSEEFPVLYLSTLIFASCFLILSFLVLLVLRFSIGVPEGW